MTNLEPGFNQFISMRMEYIANSVLSNSDDYRQLIRECNQYFVKLTADLPLECQQILQLYDTSAALLQGMAETLMYTQGLKDGLSFNKLLAEE